MNIKEALEWSKSHGGSHVSRAHPKQGTLGWIAWCEESFVYKLAFEDMTATDWEPSAETVSRITNGRWAVLEPKT
jgi:hypothetical protein